MSMHDNNGYTIGSVGATFGPCGDEACLASGCRTAREIAATLCSICEKPAGQGVHLVFVRTTVASLAVAHHVCFLKTPVKA